MDSRKEYEQLLQKISDPKTSDSERARAAERLQAVAENMQKEAAANAKRAMESVPNKNVPGGEMNDIMERAMRGENVSESELRGMQERMMKQTMASMSGTGMDMRGMEDIMERAMRGENISEAEIRAMQEKMMKQMSSMSGGAGMDDRPKQKKPSGK